MGWVLTLLFLLDSRRFGAGKSFRPGFKPSWNSSIQRERVGKQRGDSKAGCQWKGNGKGNEKLLWPRSSKPSPECLFLPLSQHHCSFLTTPGILPVGKSSHPWKTSGIGLDLREKRAGRALQHPYKWFTQGVRGPCGVQAAPAGAGLKSQGLNPRNAKREGGSLWKSLCTCRWSRWFEVDLRIRRDWGGEGSTFRGAGV